MAKAVRPVGRWCSQGSPWATAAARGHYSLSILISSVVAANSIYRNGYLRRDKSGPL